MKKPITLLTSLMTLIGLSAPPAFSTCGGGGGGGMGGLGGDEVFLVPWKAAPVEPLPPGDALTLTLYWFPASTQEYQTSGIRYSRLLSLHSMRCVSLFNADAKTPLGQKLAAGASLPLAVLASGDGSIIGKAENVGGKLEVAQVEQLLNAEIKKRQSALLEQMDSAKAKETSGDNEGAIAEYRKVVQQKCMFPRIAGDAARRLKKLGVNDVSFVPAAAEFDVAVTEKVDSLMKAGLKAELSDDYAGAERLFLKAHRLDPGDPTPFRYLGELYRHEIGDWQKARKTFETILAGTADPVSRAVALHGLGKMTIHEGHFKKGEALMEESVGVYPLALACRNLAVYFNSEGDFAQAEKYTRQAFELDPSDKFNAVFAAVFMAAGGKKEEALKIAQENEGLLPASYNLAAIYAQAGQKDKALELLKRHFFTYERNQSVRSKEMMEARVDRVFLSLRDDPAFLALTNDADGMLPMQPMTAGPAGKRD